MVGGHCMRRRDMIRLASGAAALSLVLEPSFAQQNNRVRRVGVLSQFAESEARANTAVFVKRLRELGWTEGRNISFDLRWGAGNDLEARRKHARELIALAPDVILASSAVAVEVLQEQTRTIPIVFAGIIDPV